MEKISLYILTKDSERFLKEILTRVQTVVDEIVIIDSGSSDKTEAIAKEFGAKFIFHEFKDFRSQREFATSVCSYRVVLFLDSDEVPSLELINELYQEKVKGFPVDVYRFKRVWNVLGRDIHNIYPIISPDYPIRVINRDRVSLNESNLIHEKYTGYSTEATFDNSVKHITFQTRESLEKKLEFYSDIASNDIIENGRSVNVFKFIFSPISAFIKWFFLKRGFLDGRVGLILGVYAFRYTLKKYQKARVKLFKELNV